MLILPKENQNKKNLIFEKYRKKIRHFHQYLIGGILNLISHWFKLHPKTLILIRRALELGNPTATIWPSETIPMTSRLLAGGFWNYSFFQFHRNFFFPYWAHFQYNPKAKSFIPRSHNILSINQTHRNWVSISFPGKPFEVSVDMAGAIMPEYDSYTIEFAILENGKLIRPHDEVNHLKISLEGPDKLLLSWRDREIFVEALQNGIRVTASGEENLVLSVRPFNMEGPALLYRLWFNSEKKELGGDVHISFKKNPDAWQISNLHSGDALKQLENIVKNKKNSNLYRIRKKKIKEVRNYIKDSLGLATASFLYNKASDIDWFVQDKKKYHPPKELIEGLSKRKKGDFKAQDIWQKWFGDSSELELPKPYHNWYQYSRWHLMTLWDFQSITPGSFTYHHFWIRDAVFMLNALLLIGAAKPVRKVLERFPGHVRRNGLFHSQAGEWDANGQALYILARYAKFTGDIKILEEQKNSIEKMILWIEKVCDKNGGILPPGFSAEHLGVADWYLWDNFWALGGLQEIAQCPVKLKVNPQKVFQKIKENLNSYLANYSYYPAALGRGKDAGMIGSLSAIYPLQLSDFINEKLYKTIEIIRKDYFFRGGFFQENIHSGINPYLTFQVAESLLYLGFAEEAWALVKKIFSWAQKAYTYPEAVHPKTRGGCMGDGFHGWAFAEVVTYFHNILYRETPAGPLFLGGIPVSWLKKGFSVKNLSTLFGRINLICKENEIFFENFPIQKSFILRLPKGYQFVVKEGLSKKWTGVSATEFGWLKVPSGLMVRLTPEKENFSIKIT